MAGTDRNVVLVAPELCGSPGGVQTFMRLCARALSEHGRLDAIHSLLDDPAHGSEPCLAAANETFFGYRGSKIQFIRGILRFTHQPHVVVFGHIAQAPIGLLLRAVGKISGYVVILHGIEAWKRLSLAQRAAVQGAKGVVVTTPYTERELLRHNPGLRISAAVLPLCVEPEKISTSPPRVYEPVTSDRPLGVLTVSRLAQPDRMKGIDHVLRAIAAVRERLPVEYSIAGDGPDRGRLEALANTLGLNGIVRFLGNVTNAQLRESFERADVFVLTSKGEGFGLVYLEAMGHGLPIVASPVGGVPWVVQHGVEGVHVPYGDSASLAAALLHLADPMVRKTLGRAGLHASQTRFSYARFAANLSEILERV